jgi:hypothetical protein
LISLLFCLFIALISPVFCCLSTGACQIMLRGWRGVETCLACRISPTSCLMNRSSEIAPHWWRVVTYYHVSNLLKQRLSTKNVLTLNFYHENPSG